MRGCTGHHHTDKHACTHVRIHDRTHAFLSLASRRFPTRGSLTKQPSHRWLCFSLSFFFFPFFFFFFFLQSHTTTVLASFPPCTCTLFFQLFRQLFCFLFIFLFFLFFLFFFFLLSLLIALPVFATVAQSSPSSTVEFYCFTYRTCRLYIAGEFRLVHAADNKIVRAGSGKEKTQWRKFGAYLFVEENFRNS